MKTFSATVCAVVATLFLTSCGQSGNSNPGSSGGIASSETAWEVAQDNAAYQAERQNFASPNSPQARIVAAIAAKLEPVVRRAYGKPFDYYVTNDADPNAYSYYGPRVYVSVGMVNFAKNREELAGVLCHESGHVMHHDGRNSAMAGHRHNLRIDDLIAHHHGTFARLVSIESNAVQLHFSQSQEYNADKAGATICSTANINPWGLVWMLQLLQRQPAYETSRLRSYLTDHPSNQARIKALTRYLRNNSQFAIWPSSVEYGTRK